MVTKVSNTVVNTQMEAQFKRLPATSGLNFVISEGYFSEEAGNGGIITFPEQTLVLTDNATNWIYLDFTNIPATLEVNTTKPDEDILLMHQVVTVSGSITSHTDYRWKTPFNRYVQPAFWPSNESEIIWFKHKTSVGVDNIQVVRGLDTPYQRWTEIRELKAADTRLVGDDSTSGTNAYGHWRSLRTDGKYMVQQRSVNSSTTVPFLPFKRDTGSQNSDVDWIALSTPPQMIDDSSTPIISQLHYTEYNPVYNEVIVSGNNWWVYDDNDNDTFTVNRPIDSFDVAPLGSGVRTYRASAFSADGEWFCTSYAGGNSIQFYARSSTGARYQQTNTITTLDSAYNGAIIVWDEANSEFIAKTAGSEFERMAGFSYNSGTGNWELAWEEDSTTNPDYDTGEVDAATESVWVSPDGNKLIIFSRATLAYGINGFNRRIGGGWDFDPTYTILDSSGTSLRTAGENWDGLYPLSGSYYLLCNYSGGTDHPDRIYKHNGSGSLQHVMDMGPTSYSFDFSAYSGPPGSPTGVLVLKDGTNSDPSDAILNKHRPYQVWTPWSSVGDDVFDYRKLIGGWSIEGNETSLEKGIAFRNNATTVPGSWANGAGPLPNTYAAQAATATDIDLEGYFPDNDRFLCDTITTEAQAGMQGTVVIVFKTPTSWPALSHSATQALVLWNFGNSSVGGVQPNMGLGVSVESAGTVAYPKVWHGMDSGSDEWLMQKGTTALSTNTWYIWHLVSGREGDRNSLHINGIEETLNSASPTLYQWHGGYYSHLAWAATATRRVRLLSEQLNSDEFIGGWIHAIAYYLDPLNDVAIAQMANEYGLS